MSCHITVVNCCPQQVVNGNSAAAQPVVAVQEADQVDYSSWPVKELRRFLTERGEDPSSIVEKIELVSRVCQCTKLVRHGTDAEGLLGLRDHILAIIWYVLAWRLAAAGIV